MMVFDNAKTENHSVFLGDSSQKYNGTLILYWVIFSNGFFAITATSALSFPTLSPFPDASARFHFFFNAEILERTEEHSS